MKKGDSGKAYHVRKELKRKKKRDKELKKFLDQVLIGPHNRQRRGKDE